MSECSYSSDSFFEFYRNGIKQIFTSLTGQSLDFHFTIEDEITAYAISVSNSPVVCISTSLLTGIYDYIYRLCENPSFFPQKGSPHNTDTHRSERAKAVIDGDKIIYSTSLFHNPERLGFANMLANLTVWFILMHEIGHYIEGHLTYLSNSQNLSFLAMNENQTDTTDSYKCYERQCIEMFADIFAGLSLSCHISHNQQGEDIFAGFANTEEARYTILNAAITILFSFLDEIFFFNNAEDLKYKYYLPTAFRNTLFLNTVFQHLSAMGSIITRNEYHASIQIMRMGVILSISDTFNDFKTNFFHLMDKEEILMEHYKTIFSMSENLKNILLNYSLIDLNKLIPPIHILNGYFSKNDNEGM